ncbi:hypothetical protein N5079_21245 [Planotetraspora sp. A-T 1434]|uniref:hypothetical protein n=1 Tax=Planotetraspora sp. A-T 1434 TaxID=2979219 RepID=UPI0021C047D6|nr:hypothetical protein [Planotetraspora sp. A-T 1434]MCT9932733.1 hypothetical protein [Planotetraspora sp. A-T 1434]
MNEWPELPEIRDDIPPPPGPEIIRSVLMRSVLDGVDAPPVPRTVRAWTLLVMEARIPRRALWLTSALVMAVSVGFVLAKRDAAELVLALVAPLIAGMGVAGSYGPERDDAFEVVAVTPTSPRVVLLARMTLVFGYDLMLALLASAVLTVLHSAPVELMPLIAAWFGPMALLSALSLLLSVCWTAEGAIGVALAVWSLYALTATGLPILDGVKGFWTTSPATVALALVLAFAAVIAAGRGEPIRRVRATHWS